MVLISEPCLGLLYLIENIIILSYSDLNAFIIKSYQEKKVSVILVKGIIFYYINIL